MSVLPLCPFRCDREIVIELRIKEEKIAERTGLTRPAVSHAIKVLETAGSIRVERSRSKITGEKKISIYLLLHPTTREPLRSMPQEFGICHMNGFERPYVTVPKETREVLTQLRPAACAVYLTALAVASKFMTTSFTTTREYLKTESLLGKNGFNRGFAECRSKGLFAYRRNVLTLHDPRTRKPSERQPREFVHHEDANWKFPLDAVTPEQWQRVIEILLHKQFFVGPTGWTYTRPEILCPSCKRERSFSASFALSQFNCHECGASGRLFQLVARVRRCTAREAKQFIAAHMDQKPAACAAA